MIDLHLHSIFSDGSYTPEELVDMGIEAGLAAMALTDHDSTNGLERFMAAGRGKGLTTIPGIEISVTVDKGTLHMLGYYIQQGHPVLEDVLIKIREGRNIRNKEILVKLQSLGMKIEWEDVASLAGDEVVGRPHFAQVLLSRGYVKTWKEAFDGYLAKGKKAYVDRFRLPAAESIAAIREAGGVAVLSHPFTLDLGKKELRKYVAGLVDLGLAGIEVYYSEHSNDQIREYKALVDEFNIIATGGSDFHGDINPSVKLGVGFGNLVVEDSILDDLNRCAGV